ncbi:MAG: cobalamin-dependent protein [Oligoflexia bacterium]|nr:cobalamin-dependent protein [Oligoflexia bacterium]
MKVILIQPPRKYWPYLNEGDNYILPLWMPCLAAICLQKKYQIICIDCMSQKIGWNSLSKILAKEKPDVVGVSESHSLYIEEGLHLVKLIKKISPQTKVIAGGGHYSNQYKFLLPKYPIDFIVIGEGEHTFDELLTAIENNQKNYSSIKGITYLENNNIVVTNPRPLIENLDELPFPAYHLMPMDRYGTSKYLFSPGGITISHSRGCLHRCSFCSWWPQMAERTINDGKEKLTPKWRSKSVTRTITEIEYLINNFNKKFFIFVDGTWNIDSEWNLQFSEQIIKKNLDIKWFSFVRADCLQRDEKNGTLKKMVTAGLAHICVGIEHSNPKTLESFSKVNSSFEMTKKTLDIFHKHYPQVFLQGTFIIGHKNESQESLDILSRQVKKLKLDFPAFHALTPVPGTEIYEQMLQDKKIEVTDFGKYDWNTPIMGSDYLSREELAYNIYLLYKRTISCWWFLKGIFSPYKYKRNLYIWWVMVTIKVFLSDIKRNFFSNKDNKSFKLVIPKWYNT